jgi:2-amino-4-hydroxy-6-hydroxymethyldihydropteridine diphosphokinase
MILIALGANLPSSAGPPAATLKAAPVRLEERGITILTASSLYEAPAWPDPADPAFINAVAAIQTALMPAQLLALLHSVEAEFGRIRSLPNAPRSLDLDLLDYDGLVTEGGLVLPHPRMTERAFVLVPLAEIAPGWRHPVTGTGVADLLAGLPGQGGLKKLA